MGKVAQMLINHTDERNESLSCQLSKPFNIYMDKCTHPSHFSDGAGIRVLELSKWLMLAEPASRSALLLRQAVWRQLVSQGCPTR